MTSTTELAPHADSPDPSLDPSFDPVTHPDWITYNEAAELTGKVTKTISRAVKAETIRGRTADGRMYVSVTDMIAAGMVSAEKAAEGGNVQDTLELIRLRESNVGLREQLATATAAALAREAEIERAVAQLREKDTQIARLLKIVEHNASRGGQR